MGSWDTYEIPESRSYRIGERWDEHELRQEFVVTWTSSGPTDNYPGEGDLLDNIPHPTTRLAPATYAPTATYSNWMKNFICRSVEVEPIRDRPYSWRVRATYRTPNWLKPNSGNQNSFGVEYVKQTRISGRRQVQLFRLGVTPPTGGTAAYPPTTDIGGTKVDVQGKPMAGHVTQQQIQIEALRDRTPTSGTTADDPDWATIVATFVNTRNSVSFLGWPAGSVLCTGITATLDSEVWRFSAQFLYDEWFHLIQVPVSYPTGEPILGTGPTLIGVPQRSTDKVYWFQQYPNTSSFSLLFGTAISIQFTDAGPVRP